MIQTGEVVYFLRQMQGKVGRCFYMPDENSILYLDDLIGTYPSYLIEGGLILEDAKQIGKDIIPIRGATFSNIKKFEYSSAIIKALKQNMRTLDEIKEREDSPIKTQLNLTVEYVIEDLLKQAER